jgi:subtilisin family serine protease
MRPNNDRFPFRSTALRLSLALSAALAALLVATAAEAGWFGARGFGGHGGMFGYRGSVRMVNPGRNRIVGNPVKGGFNQISGGRNSHGDDGHSSRPRLPKVPKIPLIVAVPTVTTVTPSRDVIERRFTNDNGGGGGGNTGGTTNGQSAPRRLITGVPPSGEQRYVPDEVLIQLAATVTTEAIDSFARSMRLQRVESFTANGITMFRWRIPDPARRSVPTVIRALEAQSIVVAAQPNYLYRLQGEPAPSAQGAEEGDPAQYALAKLRLPQAHTLSKGERVLVAVIDSAIDTTHPELEGVVADSYDALEKGEGPGEGPNQHGTAVAGAIVAHARLMGAAPKASILAIRAFGLKGSSTEATSYSINKGIVWAIGHGARVINMSFVGPRDPSIEQRLGQARTEGIVLIAAVGNAGPKSEPLYPAAYPNVIAVTATDADDKLYSGANRGKHIAVSAPGVDVLLPIPDRGYKIFTGTSFAAAEVSGVVALLLERKADLGHEGVRRVLMRTAHDLGPKGFDPQFGAGLADAYAAIRALEPDVVTTGARLTPDATAQ